MNSYKKNCRLAGTVLPLLLLSSLAAQAFDTPKFSITPIGTNYKNAFFRTGVPITAPYSITNNTRVNRTLTLKPQSGLSIVPGGTCSGGPTANTFYLAAGVNCTLFVQASTEVKGGPVICKTKSASDTSADPLLCSQPAANNELRISRGKVAYISNLATNTGMVQCFMNADGSMYDCFTSQDPLLMYTKNVAVDFTNTSAYAYVVNENLGSVVSCPINTMDASLGTCVTNNNSFSNPIGIAVNPSVTNPVVYVGNTNDIPSTVSSCPIAAGGGSIQDGTCVKTNVNTFIFGIAAGTNNKVYLSNGRQTGQVQVCSLDGTNMITTCTTDTNSPMETVTMAINPSSTAAYMIGGNSSGADVLIYSCPLNSNGSFGQCNAPQSASSLTSGLCNQPVAMQINYAQDAAYLACVNLPVAQPTVFRCPLNANLSLGNCQQQVLGISGNYIPSGLALSN